MICFALALALPLFAASTLAVFDTIRRRRDRFYAAANRAGRQRLRELETSDFHERDTLPDLRADDERPTLPTFETARAEALARFKP